MKPVNLDLNIEALDLKGPVLALLREPEVQKALQEALRPMVAEEVRRALTRRDLLKG